MNLAGKAGWIASSARSHLAEFRKHAPLVWNPATVPYLGWAAENNLGDDVILEAHEASLGVRLHQLPRVGLAGSLRPLAVAGPRTPKAALLGGGTVLGREECHEPLTALLRQWPKLQLLMLGAGVEDPAFKGIRTYADQESLARWKPLLQRFDAVTVRGPLSQEILDNVGITSSVVGDPALLLADDALMPPGEGIVAVNVSQPEDSWGGSLQDSREVLIQVLTELQRRHHVSVRLFVCHPSDVAPSLEVRNRLDGPTDVVWPTNAAEAQAALRECTVLVGERLHALVLAASVFVPALAIEYRPKCLDFQSSVGLAAYSVRSDRLERDRLLELVLQLTESAADLRQTLFAHVSHLKDLLASAQARNAEVLAC